MIKKCECQHDIHFEHPKHRGHAHKYGALSSTTQPVKTNYGTFNVCIHCKNSCLLIYRLGPEVQS